MILAHVDLRQRTLYAKKCIVFLISIAAMGKRLGQYRSALGSDVFLKVGRATHWKTLCSHTNSDCVL